MTTGMPMTPFTITVAEGDLDNLRRRLDSAKSPIERPDGGGDYRTGQTFLRSAVDRVRAWAF